MDPIQPQSVPPVAPQADPSQMPQGAQDGGQPVTAEQRQTLLDFIQQMKAKLGSLSAVRFASGNKTELLRRDLLKQVFEKLQMAGVDLSNKESVAAFIMKLQENNPELATMFEKAMDALLGGQNGGAFGTPQDPNAQVDLGVPPQNNMNNTNPNEAVPQSP